MTSDSRIAVEQLIHELPGILTGVFKRFPPRCFDSWDFTVAGNNFGHPIVLGELSRVAWDARGVHFVAMDLHLNEGNGIKFQPDVVGLDSNFKPLIFIDYESPNSSDSRIPTKDILAFNRWPDVTGATTPYVIITALPDAIAHAWKLEWTARNKWNEHLKGRRNEVRANPYRFWYSYYSEKCKDHRLDGITFLNINGIKVERIDLSSWSPK